MRLSRVIFNHPVTLPNGQRGNEFTSIGFPEAEFEYEPNTGAVRLGRRLFGSSSWRELELVEDLPTCPECAQAFADARALGSHRSYVHGVAGTSRKPKEVSK